MCVVLTLLLVFILLYYADAVLASLAVYEQLGSDWVQLEQGWNILTVLWPLGLLFIAVGILLTLVFLKIKKVL